MKYSLGFLLMAFFSACGGSSSAPSSGTVITGAVFTVTAANAPVSYTINNAENPTLTLQRGKTYGFNLSTIGHPFFISTTAGTNTANTYSSGVSGNASQSGTLTFAVPLSAPNTLYYDCTFHSAMSGTLNITN